MEVVYSSETLGIFWVMLHLGVTAGWYWLRCWWCFVCTNIWNHFVILFHKIMQFISLSNLRRSQELSEQMCSSRYFIKLASQDWSNEDIMHLLLRSILWYESFTSQGEGLPSLFSFSGTLLICGEIPECFHLGQVIWHRI